MSQQEEFFNGRTELSGIVLLEKGQSVCLKKEGAFPSQVKLGQLMLEGGKTRTSSMLTIFGEAQLRKFGQYLIANGLRTVDRDEDDPHRLTNISACLDALLKAKGWLAMGGQIIDATVIEARRPRLTQAEKATIKGGGTPAEWTPARRAQIDRDGRWNQARGLAGRRSQATG